MIKLMDAERKPTRKLDAAELRRLVVSLVVIVDDDEHEHADPRLARVPVVRDADTEDERGQGAEPVGDPPRDDGDDGGAGRRL